MLILSVSPLWAQQSDAPFWNQPDKEVKDAKGKVTYSVTHDRSNNTMRVLDHGNWFVYHYDPKMERVTGVDTAGTSEVSHFDKNGNSDGVTVRFNGLSLSVYEGREGIISTPGLPTITPRKDQKGRHSALVTSGGDEIASFHFDPKGYLRRLSIDGKYRLDLQQPKKGLVSEMLSGPSGQKIREAAALGNKDKRAFPVCLDPVSRTLGLGDDWANSLRFSSNATRSLTTVTTSDDKVVLYIVEFANTQVGFDARGNPLFYDISVNFDDATTTGEDAGSSIMTEMRTVAPSRIIYTVDGRTGACLSEAASGAISSFWIDRENDGGARLRYRILNPQGEATVKSASPEGKSRSPRLHAQPNTYYICDMSIICTSCDGCGSFCTTTTYYCFLGDSTDGSGATSGSTSLGGGGTLDRFYGNHITGDSLLTAALNRAFDSASEKWHTPPCSDLLDLHDANGNTLRSNLAAKTGSPDFLTWMVDDVRWINGYTSGECANNNSAYTNVGTRIVKVCSSFKNLSEGTAANRIIHETLHTLGLPESTTTNPNPNYMTSSQINQYIGSKCGGF